MLQTHYNTLAARALLPSRRECHPAYVDLILPPVEARVLGSLIEKDLATPDYYPLSLNALTNACNQKTNRDPITAYEDADVRAALETLRELRFAAFVTEAGSRVEKYRHRMSELYNLSRGELAILAVLMLRGPQTVAELRERTSRMHAFADHDTTQHALNKLAAREPNPFAVLMPKAPGTKEPRWAHLFGGEPAMPEAATAATVAASPLHERITALEEELRRLREDFESFKAQF
jgi:uncharacterized protein